MKESLHRGQLVIFAMPAMVSVIMHAPVAGILPSLYAATFGLSLATIATVLLSVRVFDAIIDPVIGLLSDRTVTRYGKRKPWIVVGSTVAVIALFFLMRPGDRANTAYFLVLMLVLQFAWTVMEIPYSAWVLELSRDPGERTRLNAYRAGAILAGGILFTIAPALVAKSGGHMNFDVMGVLAVVLVVAVPLATAAAVNYIPRGEIDDARSQPKISELWGSVKGNRPFQLFVLIYVFIGLASGISGVLSFMYLESYLGIGGRYTELLLPAELVGPLSLPVWMWLLRRFDRLRLTAYAFGAYALIMPVPWFIGPGPGAFAPMLFFFMALSVFAPLLMITMPTLLGDVIDFDELRTGKNRAGQYNAFLILIAKGTGAVGGPLALALVAWFGFQPGAVNGSTAITAFRVVYVLVPALLVIPGVALLWYFPLDARRQRDVHAGLLARFNEGQAVRGPGAEQYDALAPSGAHRPSPVAR